MRKNVIYIQEDASSCGAVSIASILSFYGGYVPLEKILEDTSTDKSGTNALELVRALSLYGFSATGKRVSEKDLGSLTLPAIAHVSIDGYEHFVVIYELKGSNIIAMDPACGKKIYSKDEFRKIFTGHVIEVVKEGDIPHYRKSQSIRRLLLNVLKTQRRNIFKIAILNIAIALLGILSSFHLKALSIVSDALIVTALFVIIRVIAFELSNVRIIALEHLNKRLEDDTVYKFVDHLLQMPLSVLKRKRTGELLRKVEELSFIKELVVRLCFLNTLDVLTIIMTLVISSSISKRLTCIYLVLAIGIVLLTPFLKKKIFRSTKEVLKSNDEYKSTLIETLDAIESVKNLNKEDVFLETAGADLKKYTGMRERANRFLTMTDELKMYIYDSAIFLVNFIGFSLLNESFTLYDLMLIESLFALLYSSLESLMDTFVHLIKAKVSYRSLSELLDVEEEKRTSSVKEDFKDIAITDFSYSYDSLNRVVDGISLRIARGDKILLCGPSGVGKSTLVKCLAGYYASYMGKISLNGKDIKSLGTNILRNYIVYVGQEETLFRKSVAENIALGDFDEKRFKEVIAMTKVDEIIKKRREGKDTVLLEGASNLSGGERSRIILARALYKRPAVLIVDETLSSVDLDMEDEIIANLQSMEELTLIYITHRDKKKLFNDVITLRKD